MKSTIKISVLIILFFAVNSYAQMSLSDGLNAAKSSNKKVVLFIGSSSDTWTKKMQSEVYSNAAVQASLANFILVNLDADSKTPVTFDGKSTTVADLAKSFNATGYPSHVFLNSDGSVIRFKYNGEEVMNFAGYVEAAEFQKMLNYFNTDQYKTTDLSKVF
jgi:thioredoxin-related protein